MGLKKRRKKRVTVINEYDQNPAYRIQKKYRRKRRKRRIRILFILFILSVVVCYFVSPISRIQKISIEGNKLVETSIIEQKISCTNKSIRMFVSKKQIKKQVESIDGVKKAKINKSLFNGLTIKITEASPIAYHQSDQVKIVFDTGEVLETTDVNLIKQLQVLSKMTGFDEESLKLFAVNFSQIEESVRLQISEIQFEPLETDPERVKLISNDNKISYIRISDMVYQLANYNQIITKYPNDCYFDFLKGHVYKRSCE